PKAEEMKAISRALAKEVRPPGNSPEAKSTPLPENQPAELQPAPAEAPAAAPVQEDLLARWTQELIKEADRWEWNDLIKDSPALREGFRDLQHLLADQGARRPLLSSELARWTAGLEPPGGSLLKLPDWMTPQG